jgi:hypothetical protein
MSSVHAEPAYPGRAHLEQCSEEGCDWCNHLLSIYTACDECGHWMNNECEHYYDQESGQTLCHSCEPKEGGESNG